MQSSSSSSFDTPPPPVVGGHDLAETPDKHHDATRHIGAPEGQPVNITVGIGPYVNNEVVPLVNSALTPIINMTDVQDNDDMFIVLGSWIHKAVRLNHGSTRRAAIDRGTASFDYRNWRSSPMYRELHSALEVQYGKHSRLQWAVDVEGNPYNASSVICVKLRGVDLSLLAVRRVMAVKYSEAVLRSLTVFAQQDLVAHTTHDDEPHVPETPKAHAKSAADSTSAVSKAIADAYASALDDDAKRNLKNLCIKWYPSKHTFMYGQDYASKCRLKMCNDKRKSYSGNTSKLAKCVKRHVRKAHVKLCKHVKSQKVDDMSSCSMSSVSSAPSDSGSSSGSEH